MGGFVDGYDLLILSAALLLLIPHFHLDAARVGILVASAYLGSFFGAMIFGYYTDLRGRRGIFILDLALFIVFSIISGLSPNYTVLLISRFLLGVAIGMDFPTAGAMIAEFAPAHARGRLLSVWQLLWAVGALIAPLVAITLLPLGPDAWRWMLASGAVPAAIVLVGRRFVPETPRWLMSQGKIAEAHTVLAWAGRTERHAGTAVPQHDAAAPETRLAEQTRFGEMFNSRYRRLTIIISLVCFAGAFGPLFLSSYTAFLAKYYGFSSNLRALEFGTIIWFFYIVGNVINFLLTDRVGRKPMLIGGAILVTVTLLIASRTSISNITLVFAVLIFAAIGHWGGVDQGLWQYSAEVFPTRIRGTARGFTTSWIRLSAFLSALLTPTLLKRLGFGSTMLLFAGIEVIVIVLAFALPEVKGRALEDIAKEGRETAPASSYTT